MDCFGMRVFAVIIGGLCAIHKFFDGHATHMWDLERGGKYRPRFPAFLSDGFSGNRNMATVQW
jgi:hypothetical protein